MVPPPILNVDRFITTFGSIFASVTLLFTICASIFVFVFTVFRDESSVAPRLSCGCTQKNITSAGTSVLWVQHLPRRCLGRKASSSQEKHALLETTTKLKTRSSLLVSLMIPVQSFSSQRSPNCCSQSLMGENANAATDTTHCEFVQQNQQAHSGETNRDFARLHTDKKLRNSNTRSEGCSRFAPPAAEDCAIAAPIFRAPQRVCQGSRWALQVDCPEVQPYLGSCVIFCTLPRS